MSIKEVEEFLKAWGPLIGPFLAFMLGIWAMWIKNWFDTKKEKGIIRKKMADLVAFVKVTEVPKFQDEGNDNRWNTINLARFLKKCILIKSMIENLDKDLHKYGNLYQINQYNSLKWWLDIVLKQVRNMRDSDKLLCESDFEALKSIYENLLTACDDKNLVEKYIYPST